MGHPRPTCTRVVAYVVTACVVMAYVFMAYVFMAYVVMAYVVMVYAGMDYIVMAYVVVTYIVMTPRQMGHPQPTWKVVPVHGQHQRAVAAHWLITADLTMACISYDILVMAYELWHISY